MAVWDKIANLLEFAQTVQFASSIGAVSQDTARQELPKQVKQAQEIETVLVQPA
jgi:hypothetical protein